MKKNYLNLKKIFMTFDKHFDGFILIDDLKSILSQFTLPMSDQLFNQLMERYGHREHLLILMTNLRERWLSN